MRTSRLLLLCLAAVLSLSAAPAPAKPASVKTDLLWDRYGVPHIYAPNREAMFYAHGWAQAKAQGNLLLELYGESRGRAAEYWGRDYRKLDRWLQLNSMPERAKAWYAAQDPAFRKYLDAFARGINDFLKQHPDAIDSRYRVVLPVTGVDIVGHPLRVVHYMYMGSEEALQNEVKLATHLETASLHPLTETEEKPGSNTWAIGPKLSAGGKPMLLINPHLAWGNTFYRYMEVHLTAPDYDLYGAPQVGFPVPIVGFNRHAGWGRTVNTIDTVDFYRLHVEDGGYRYDGKVRRFETEEKVLKIRNADGSYSREALHIRRTVQGPVVYDKDGLTLAMRVAGLDRPRMLEQWFRMGEARNLQQFTEALKMMAVPMWHANYAGSDGHIMIVFDGLVPRRKQGDWAFWQHLVPGDTSATMWDGYLSFDELPKSTDPGAGFNQNENEAPWFFSEPRLDPARYAAYVAPPLSQMPSFRTKRALRMLHEKDKISYEQFLLDKHSTRVEAADSLLPDLLAITKDSGDPEIQAAAAVLSRWDRQTEAASRGAVLFQLFFEHYFGRSEPNARLRVKYDPNRFLDSAYGIANREDALAALKSAAQDCRNWFGSLDKPWGEVFRWTSGTANVPANGGPSQLGVFRTMRFGPISKGQSLSAHGETFVCVIEFSASQQAQCVLGYGNSSQPGSPHLVDQLPLLMEKKLHPVWRDRQEVAQHLEQRQTLP